MGNIISDPWAPPHDEQHFAVAQIIELCVLSIALIVQCAIALNVSIQWKKHPDIRGPVNSCFVLTLICSLMFTITNIVIYAYDPFGPFGDDETQYTIARFNILLFAGLFHISVLLTYIVRLYTTFKSSVYRMSNALIAMFIVIMALLTMGWFTFSALYVLVDATNTLLISLSISFLSLYVIGCVLAVHFFVSNLSKLIESQVTTPNEGNTVEDIKLSLEQRKLSDLSSKYTMLFAFAITSTIMLIVIAMSAHLIWRASFVALDLCINMWCLYLKFSFSENHYKKCCGCCDKRCKNYGVKRTRKRILHKSGYSMVKYSEGNEETVEDI